jgi:hypothetical protein
VLDVLVAEVVLQAHFRENSDSDGVPALTPPTQATTVNPPQIKVVRDKLGI